MDRDTATGRTHYRAQRIIERVLCLCLVIPFCEPAGLSVFLPFSWNYFILFDGTFLLMCVVMLKRIRLTYLYIGIFYIVILASTMINSGDAFIAVCFAAKMICFVILIDLYVRYNRIQLLLSTFKLVLGLCVLITLFFQVIDQDIFGYTPSNNIVNFLTADNDLGYWYLPFTLIVYLSDIHRSKRYRTVDFIFWVTVCISSLIIAWSATCMVVYILFVFFFVFHKMKIFNSLTPLRSLMANIGFSVLVIFYQMQNLFGWLIEDILHKDMTLSGRSLIWASAIQNILRKPILGYGTTPGGRMSINRIMGGARFFSHNIFLEILIQGGFIGFLCYIAMYYFANREISRSPKTDLSVAINISVLFILLMQFSEFALYEPFANLPLILCFFYKALLRAGFAKDAMEGVEVLRGKGET